MYIYEVRLLSSEANRKAILFFLLSLMDPENVLEPKYGLILPFLNYDHQIPEFPKSTILFRLP